MAVVAPQSPASVGFLVLMEEPARFGICPVEGERIVGHELSVPVLCIRSKQSELQCIWRKGAQLRNY